MRLQAWRITLLFALLPRPLTCLRQPQAAWFMTSSMRSSWSPSSSNPGAGQGYTAVLVVPTGIGASVGGYAGDALPVARTVSSVVDTLVTHPNVMNGAMMYWPENNILYTEGFALDEFAAGRWGLAPLTQGGHRIGLVLDAGMDEEARVRHLQVADAARSTLGIDVASFCVTDEPLGVEVAMTPAGASFGTLARPESLLRAARRLIHEAGCTALAVVGKFPDEEDEVTLDAYRYGDGVDTVGGAEAIISHLVTSELKVPCAHAPALAPLDVDPMVSPRASAEELGYTFLSCVLANLHRAPALISDRTASSPARREPGEVWADHVNAVLVPRSACGGSAVLSLSARDVLLLVIEDNETAMQAPPELLGLDQPGNVDCQVVHVQSYLEAVGVLAAHKAGIRHEALRPGAIRIPVLPDHGTSMAAQLGNGSPLC